MLLLLDTDTLDIHSTSSNTILTTTSEFFHTHKTPSMSSSSSHTPSGQGQPLNNDNNDNEVHQHPRQCHGTCYNGQRCPNIVNAWAWIVDGARFCHTWHPDGDRADNRPPEQLRAAARIRASIRAGHTATAAAAATAEVETLRSVRDELRGRLDDAEGKLSKARAKAAAAAAAEAAASAAAETLRGQRDEQSGRVLAESRLLEQLLVARARARASARAAAAEVETLRRERDRLRRRLGAVQDELGGARARAAAAAAAAADAAETIRGLRADAAAREAPDEAVWERDERWAVQLQARVAQARLDAREESAREMGRLREEAAAAAGRLEHVEAELGSTREAHANAAAQLEDRQASVEALRAEVGRLTIRQSDAEAVTNTSVGILSDDVAAALAALDGARAAALRFAAANRELRATVLLVACAFFAWVVADLIYFAVRSA